MVKTAVIAITKHGIEIARKLKTTMPEFDLYAPDKFGDGKDDVNWHHDPSSFIISKLFKSHQGIVCIFSLGAVIRLITPYLKDKKTDPAVVVIDDKAQFVISTLSGHLGGGNALARLIASILNTTPVITTAADVNETIAVDLLGREFGWEIDNDSTVTKVSAHMVNEDKVGVYQDVGERNWWPDDRPLPKNVNIVNSIDELSSDEYKASLVITDKHIDNKYEALLRKSVVYRPKSLVVGVGLHWDTSKDDIRKGIQTTLKNANLSFKSIRSIATINREAIVKGLQEFSSEFNIPVDYFDKNQLSEIEVPNPSDTVKKFEGTSSVSESSAMLSAKSNVLLIQKQKFPPNLTVAITRVSIN
ncbi:MAG: cobalt-precorrin 5A hydrolase [Nitrososphaerales archaeon]